MNRVLESYHENHCFSITCGHRERSKREADLPDKCSKCGAGVQKIYSEITPFSWEDFAKLKNAGIKNLGTTTLSGINFRGTIRKVIDPEKLSDIEKLS